MCSLYACFRVLVRNWLLLALLLIASTFLFGMIGFARQQPSNSLLTNAYLVAQMCTLNCGEVTKPDLVWELEVARWLGFVVWGFTLATILLRLFSQRALALLVAVCARGHVIVAGLGVPEAERDKLVEKLRKQWRNVVVIEPDAAHPGLETCRQAGAVCLIGSPFEETMMRKARLERAGTLLALSEVDRKNVTLLSLAAKMLNPGAADVPPSGEEDPLAPPGPNTLGCVVQVSEPGLLEVLRRHDLHHDANAHLHLRIFSTHEMVARAMLRECALGLKVPVLNKVLLLGTGAGGRLGEALVLRAMKDRWIDREPDQPVRRLEIDVYDEKAEGWVNCVRGGFDQQMRELCELKATDRLANRCGFRGIAQRDELEGAKYDAVFVCMSNEAHALIQAVQLREVLPERVPIIVRVHEEAAGFGKLMQRPDAGGLGKNLHVVGSHDRVFDIVASMNPITEMVAQVLHQDYLLLTQRKIRAAEDRGDLAEAAKLGNKAAFAQWLRLADEYHKSNRALAQRLRSHLTVPSESGQLARRFRLQYCPRELITPHNSFRLTGAEVEALARQEHDLWWQKMESLGWRQGSGQDPHSSDPVLKLNPNLVPWEKLAEGMKEYDRNIIRRIAHVFAKADYRVVEA